MADDEEEKAPPRKILVLNVGGFTGANISKRFAASEDDIDNFQDQVICIAHACV